MTLTKKAIARFNKMSEAEILDYAVKLHQQKAAETDADIINFPLEKDIEELHLFMFGRVPSTFFRRYVQRVCNVLGRPNWMAGMLGVSYVEPACKFAKE